jgi:hypothetical protein
MQRSAEQRMVRVGQDGGADFWRPAWLKPSANCWQRMLAGAPAQRAKSDFSKVKQHFYLI